MEVRCRFLIVHIITVACLNLSIRCNEKFFTARQKKYLKTGKTVHVLGRDLFAHNLRVGCSSYSGTQPRQEPVLILLKLCGLILIRFSVVSTSTMHSLRISRFNYNERSFFLFSKTSMCCNFRWITMAM